jgi:hypothetical protein
VDAVVGQGSQDIVEPDLQIGKSPRERGTRPERIVEAENALRILLALVIALVVEAEFLTAKGGRTAKDAIGLAMVAGGVRHGRLQNPGYQLQAISNQLRANSKLIQAVGIPTARVLLSYAGSAPRQTISVPK